MSDLIETLAKIDSSGGTVVVRDQEVRLRVRPGTLTDQDRQVLADHREVLLRLLAPALPVEDQAEREAVVRVEALDPAAAVVVEAAVREWDEITGGDQDQQRQEPEIVDQADQQADQQPDHDQHLDQGLDQWLRENTVEPVSCDGCGGLERWEDLAGGWHCTVCDPPLTAQRLRLRAEAIRRRTAAGGVSPTGSGPSLGCRVQVPHPLVRRFHTRK